MTTRPDPDPVISAWLHDEAPERAPERLLTASRVRIQSTNQRRAWRPAWRLQPMNNRVLGAAVAAIAIIVVLGIAFLPKPSGSGGPPLQSPVPSASPSPSPSTSGPAPSPSSSAASSPAVIPPGVLCSESQCLTFTVPAGWTTGSGFVSKNVDPNPPSAIEDSPNEMIFSTWFLTNVYTDACHWTKTMVSAGTTVDQLTNLLVAQKGRVAKTPTNITVGGYPAKQIQLTIPTSIDMTKCDNGLLHVWPDPGGNSGGGLCCGAAGSTDVVDVVNVVGSTFTIVARHAAGASPADLAELNALVTSITIATSPSSPAPSSAVPSPSGASPSP
jgi:hypothetical protein